MYKLYVIFLNIMIGIAYMHASSSESDGKLALSGAHATTPIKIMTLNPHGGQGQKLTPPSSSLSSPIPYTPQVSLERESDEDHELVLNIADLEKDLQTHIPTTGRGHHLLTSSLHSKNLTRLIIAHHTGLTDKNSIDKHYLFKHIKTQLEDREDNDDAEHTALVSRAQQVRENIAEQAIKRRRALRSISPDSASSTVTSPATPEVPTSQEISTGLKEADTPSEFTDIYAKASEALNNDQAAELAASARTVAQKDAVFWTRLTIFGGTAIVTGLVALASVAFNFAQLYHS